MTGAPRLDGRLASAAAFVRGGCIADIGTDHAYLPAALLLEGRAERAVASDINEGPLRRAARTVAKYRLEDRITLLLTDGLRGIDACAPDDIIIFGMGGELISAIISDAPWVRSPRIRLILQPMTRRAELRSRLLSDGFRIEGEVMSEADGRIYQTICAAYGGVTERYTDTELLLGRHNIEAGGELFGRCLRQMIGIFTARRDGRAAAGADISYEAGVLNELLRLEKIQMN